MTHTEFEEDASVRLRAQWNYVPRDMPPRQDYAVLSILAPTGTNQTLETGIAIKLYGNFATLEEANAQAKKMSRECDAYDFFVLQTCEWARLPPEVASLDDVHYQQERLEQLKNRAAGGRDEAAARVRDRLFGSKASSGDESMEVVEEEAGVAETKQ